MVITSAVLCLAANIYFESRSESLLGQKAVAAVTWNRAEYDKNNVCREVFKPGQFSWVGSKSFKTLNGYKVKFTKKMLESKEWALAKRIAQRTIDNQLVGVIKGATHFHHIKVKPKWRKRMLYVATIGNHAFYKTRTT